MFSSCFELPSPSRGPTPTTGTLLEEQGAVATAPSFDYYYAYSLPPSPTRSEAAADDDELTTSAASAASSSSATAGIAKSRSSCSRFEDHLFQGRVQLLRRLYSGGCLVTQDDSGLPSHFALSSVQSARTAATTGYFPLRRRGSCESGFFSSVSTAHTQTTTSSALPLGMSADDFFLDSELSSTRSLGSSLLTVSDLEEDLRAASVFLSSSASTSGATKRTSSVFTDSTDDLSSLAGTWDEVGGAAALMTSSSSSVARTRKDFGYEKDIRDIVEYFEATCVMENASGRRGRESAKKQLLLAARAAAIQQQQQQQKQQQQQQQPLLPRSQNIDRLIKRVVEKESRERLRKTSMSAAVAAAAGAPAAPAQVCDGIVRSKLPIFDATKRPSLLMNHRAVMMRRQWERERGPHEDHKGFVKSKMAIFDGPTTTAAECASTKKMAERRLAELMNKSLEDRK